jgi:hypothetical protein
VVAYPARATAAHLVWSLLGQRAGREEKRRRPGVPSICCAGRCLSRARPSSSGSCALSRRVLRGRVSVASLSAFCRKSRKLRAFQLSARIAADVAAQEAIVTSRGTSLSKTFSGSSPRSCRCGGAGTGRRRRGRTGLRGRRSHAHGDGVRHTVAFSAWSTTTASHRSERAGRRGCIFTPTSLSPPSPEPET